MAYHLSASSSKFPKCEFDFGGTDFCIHQKNEFMVDYLPQPSKKNPTTMLWLAWFIGKTDRKSEQYRIFVQHCILVGNQQKGK